MTKLDGEQPKVPHVPPTDPVAERRAMYNRLVREARLLGLILKGISFSAAEGAIGEKDKKHAFHRTMKSFNYFEDPSSIQCDIEWSVTIKVKRKTIAKCVAVYRVYYDEFTKVPEEIARHYAENVAFPATYAYFRALYASVDWAAGFNSPPLPVVKFSANV